MTNVTKALNDKINETLPNLVIYNDIFPDSDGDSVISRHDPSTATAREYIDGSQVGSLSISYYARSKNPATCRATLTSIIKILNEETLEDSDGLEVTVKAGTLPQYIGTDDKNQTVYSCSFNCEYSLQGD